MNFAAATGDWHLRGLAIEQYFSLNPLRDSCIDAANRASRNFSSHFPGWPLYARIVRGDDYYDRTLKAWAITCGRVLARSRQRNGHSYIKPSVRGPWVVVASLDALDSMLGLETPPAFVRGPQLGVMDKTYTKVFRPIRQLMEMGFLEYSCELEFCFREVKRQEREIIRAGNSEGNIPTGGEQRRFAKPTVRGDFAYHPDGRPFRTLYPGIWDMKSPHRS